jgi:hypothetical protein
MFQCVDIAPGGMRGARTLRASRVCALGEEQCGALVAIPPILLPRRLDASYNRERVVAPTTMRVLAALGARRAGVGCEVQGTALAAVPPVVLPIGAIDVVGFPGQQFSGCGSKDVASLVIEMNQQLRAEIRRGRLAFLAIGVDVEMEMGPAALAGVTALRDPRALKYVLL